MTLSTLEKIIKPEIPSVVIGGNSASGEMARIATQKLIEDKVLKYLRFTYACNDGVIRSKTNYVEPFGLSNSMPKDIGLAFAEQLVTWISDQIINPAPFDPVGEIRLSPDWDSFRLLHYAKGHGRVFGNFVNGRGEPWANCPRTFLYRAVHDLKRHGLYLKVAFENEFYLFSKDGTPIDTSVYAEDSAFTKSANYLEEVIESLVKSGIVPEVVHSESGNGQFEITISPKTPICAADDQIVLRSTVKDIASLKNLNATFAPHPIVNSSSSGGHINFSLWQNSTNITGNRNTLSDIASSFLAGIIKHLPSLAAITCPTTSSYERLRPGMWSGAYGAWGKSNREAAVRVPYCEGGSVTRIEFRSADAICNPYLALGAIISAGLDGIENCLKLSNEVKGDLTELTNKQLRKKSIFLLPQRMDKALNCLENDLLLKTAMGKELHASYIATKRAEFKITKNGIKGKTLRRFIERF